MYDYKFLRNCSDENLLKIIYSGEQPEELVQLAYAELQARKKITKIDRFVLYPLFTILYLVNLPLVILFAITHYTIDLELSVKQTTSCRIVLLFICSIVSILIYIGISHTPVIYMFTGKPE